LEGRCGRDGKNDVKQVTLFLAIIGAVFGGAWTLAAMRQAPAPQVPPFGVDTNMIAISAAANEQLAAIYEQARVAPSCVYGEVKHHDEVGHYLYITDVKLTEFCEPGAIGLAAAWLGDTSPETHPIAQAWFRSHMDTIPKHYVFLGLVQDVRLMPGLDGNLTKVGITFYILRTRPKGRQS
jgi:hypothetical protein